MPSSVSSYFAQPDEGDDSHPASPITTTAPPSPTSSRRPYSFRPSDANLRTHLPVRSFTMPQEQEITEETRLLASVDAPHKPYLSMPSTPRRLLSRRQSVKSSLRQSKNHSRANSLSLRLGSSTGLDRLRSNGPKTAMTMASLSNSLSGDERVWYDQFTSTDWVHDSIADGFRVRELRKRKDLRGKLRAWFDGAQGWLLVAIIGCVTAWIAYFVDVTESAIFDYKEGYCTNGWHWGKVKCCLGARNCDSWRTWSQVIQPSGAQSRRIDFAAFVIGCVVFAAGSCFLTLSSKTVVPSNISLSTLDENLGADRYRKVHDDDKDSVESLQIAPNQERPPSMTYYSAAGSGVAEVKVILSGFVLHGYLGVKTLVIKSLALVLSVAAGLSLGKEGPYVHIATCVGNIACRMFAKYNYNDGKRREILSASAASGVAVAFGAPIGGILFSLEEVSYYFPSKTLFRTFFCCIAAALTLKFLNPYGTGKIVLFEVRYDTDWRFFELIAFIFLGCLGGAAGALFIKASRFWALTFRRVPIIKKWPMLEVLIVALLTGLISFWNRSARLPVTELLLELASPCNPSSNTGLCPAEEDIPNVIRYLFVAFVIKAFLTIITFGIKVPAGIYVPSMVVGGLMGRIVGHTVQYLVLRFPDSVLFNNCPPKDGIESCVTPGVYALVAAGATMCGVTRLSVALAVILFELTGSLDHVLPFSLAILCAKWTADALEPLSIYDLLTDMNSYPFLDNKLHPVFDTELGDIVPRQRRNRLIDISASPLIRATLLREKLESSQSAGELDGGLPIIRHNILVGLIPAPDLEFALDRLENEQTALCLMATDVRWHGFDEEADDPDPTDFTPFIDPAPVALDIHSPMDLVYQVFVKLGLRYMCVLNQGEYAGLVHKKTFVKYVKRLEEEKEGAIR